MSTASKSPRKVAAVAFEIGSRTLPQFSHRFSRHDYTLPQLFTCLVLRKFFDMGYRDIVGLLDDWPTLRTDLKLQKTPHFTTLQKVERKLLRDPLIRKMLTQTIDLTYHREAEADEADNEEADKPDKPCETGDGKTLGAHVVDRVAVDSTGFETDRCSRYYIRRRSRSPGLWQTTTYRRFGKLGIAVDCDTHMILATFCGQGPKPDVNQLEPLLNGFCHNVIPRQLLADAGYDSEGNHELLRDDMDIESFIPPNAGRPSNKPPTGKWRRHMTTNFDDEAYGQRWQSETVMYMLKQHQGESLTARKYQTRRREMGLMCVVHNIMIVRDEGFYRAHLT